MHKYKKSPRQTYINVREAVYFSDQTLTKQSEILFMELHLRARLRGVQH